MAPRTLQRIIAADPAYARTLDEARAERPATPVAEAPPRQQPMVPAKAPAREAVAAQPPPAEAPTEPPRAPARAMSGERPRTRRGAKPVRAPTERIAVSIRPLLGQMDRIAATGLPTQDVLKAAWRKASTGFVLDGRHVEPSPEDRTDGPEGCYATTFTVDAEALAALTSAQDPLGVRSPWSLIRGQVEPLFWKALDELLAGLDGAGGAAKGRGRGRP